MRLLCKLEDTFWPEALSWMRGPVGAGGRTGWGPAPSGITLTAMVSVSSHSYLAFNNRSFSVSVD